MDLIEGKARSALLSCIEELEGSKAIIWSEELVGPATLLTTSSRLKELGVEKTLALNSDFYKNLDVKHILFVVRPSLGQMDLIADYAHQCSREDRNRHTRRDLRVLFIPRITQMCRRRLEERGALGGLELKSVETFLFPFDSDLISMELDNTFREMVLEEDPSSLESVAAALYGLETELGPIPRIIGRGPAAKIVTDYFLQIKKHGRKKIAAVPSSLNYVILLDRRVDLISPLATQLTYEGLIDEMFGLKNTTVQFPADRFSKEDEPVTLADNAKKVILLNSSDELYAELRDKNFNGIGPALKRKAQAVAVQLEQRRSKSIEAMRTFVSQLPQLQATKRSLAIHTTIAELIKEKTEQGSFLDSLQAEQELLCSLDTDRIIPYIEEAIDRKEDLHKVLRLLCLQSLVNSGLRPRLLEYYKREIFQVYGPKYIIPFANLEKAGLLRAITGPRNYAALKRTMKLIIEDDSEVEPTDICFTHSVYAPLSVRLLQHFRNWGTMRDILEMVPGPTVEQTFPNASEPRDDRLRVLVFFLGGCTYAEVSALRFLSQKEESNCDFIIGTTNLINGFSFLKSVMLTGGPIDC